MEQLSNKLYDALDIKICDALNDELGSMAEHRLGNKLSNELFIAIGEKIDNKLYHNLNGEL